MYTHQPQLVAPVRLPLIAGGSSPLSLPSYGNFGDNRRHGDVTLQDETETRPELTNQRAAADCLTIRLTGISLRNPSDQADNDQIQYARSKTRTVLHGHTFGQCLRVEQTKTA